MAEGRDIGAEVRRIIKDQLDVEEKDIKPESTFIDNLGADSLGLVELVLAFEEALESTSRMRTPRRFEPCRTRSTTSKRTRKSRGSDGARISLASRAGPAAGFVGLWSMRPGRRMRRRWAPPVARRCRAPSRCAAVALAAPPSTLEAPWNASSSPALV